MSENSATNQQEVKVVRTRTEKAIKKQIKTYVMSRLAKQSEEEHKRTGIFTAPTLEDIRTECKKGWQRHLDRNKPEEDLSIYFD